MKLNTLKKILAIAVVLNGSVAIKLAAESAVTYEQSPGRFGDNVLCYMHAKWIAFKYNLPLLYKPFAYSDSLVLHTQETILTEERQKQFKKTVWLKEENKINLAQDNVLYVVPYFPESAWERKRCTGFDGKKWPFIDVDWNNAAFIAELQSKIQPTIEIPHFDLPEDRISVAAHVRRGGTHDAKDVINYFPLKFVSDEFYIDQIKKIYELVHQPLYVHIFTDDLNPPALMEKFKDACTGLDIQFDCRRSNNSNLNNVVEDFFTLTQFDCLIRSESNYSFIIGKIHNYKIEICPVNFWRQQKQMFYVPHIKK